ncbi:MAG: hypothetical protein ABF289_19200 [Clostridiales bacterium]
MRNLFNKGLLYKEFKSIKLLGILMILSIFIFKTFQVFNLVYDSDVLSELTGSNYFNKNHYYMLNFYYILEFDGFSFDDHGNNMVVFFIAMIILTILLSFSQMYFDKKSRGISISFMIPVDKGTIMLNKIMVSIFTIFIVFFINTLIIIFTVLLNREILSNVIIIDILKWSLRNIMAYSLIYLVFMFIQALSINIIESVIVGFFAINIPYIVILIIKWLHDNFFISTSFQSTLETYFYFLWPLNYIVNDKSYLESFNGLINSQVYQTDVEPFWLHKILLMGFFIVIVLLLTLYFYHKNSFENHKKIVFKENILLQLAMLFVSGFGFIVLFLRFDNGKLDKFYMNPILLTAVLFATVMYILSSKYIAKNISKKLKRIDK